jgi:2-iminobutanoate/2-iminopropanoate deaminase
MERKVVTTSQAPAAIGPYSQAIVAGPFVFTAGQIPIDPATGELVTGGISEQTERVLRNLENVLAAAGAELRNVIKTTVYLSDMEDFNAMNRVYGRFFEELPPARSAVEVSRLPRNVMVEIEAIALAGNKR